MLDPQSFTANLAAEGTSIDPASWRNVGAEGVVKGHRLDARQRRPTSRCSLFVVSRGADAVLKAYDVPPADLRGAVHQFDNEVVKWFTGTAGSFGTRMVFSATAGRGQKGIFAVESDGQGVGRLPAVSNVALAPAIGPGRRRLLLGRACPTGATRSSRSGSPAPVLHARGARLRRRVRRRARWRSSSRKGAQSDIFVGFADGTRSRRSRSGGLNTHPAFGPGGELAYVSNRGGNPQIYVNGKRASWRGTYNMAPAWCNDPEGTKLVFMGRAGATWDIFSADPSGSPGA